MPVFLKLNCCVFITFENSTGATERLLVTLFYKLLFFVNFKTNAQEYRKTYVHFNLIIILFILKQMPKVTGIYNFKNHYFVLLSSLWVTGEPMAVFFFLNNLYF